jgi:NAD(P)-dependent dehydrogenase (short-subunit alcohol dehydrogenase family)
MSAGRGGRWTGRAWPGDDQAVLSGLAGKVAVVTGGAGGIGSASARRLSQEGCRVVVVDIDGDGARKVAEELPGDSAWVRADVARDDDVAEYLDVATRTFGRIDLHHLNAGIPGPPGWFPDLNAAEFDRVMAVNVRGVFLGLRGAFRRYREQRTAGSVVLTASIASLRGSADLIAYQTSKHAVLGLLRGAAMYGGPLGIRVNAVAPGIVPTDLFSAGGGATGGHGGPGGMGDGSPPCGEVVPPGASRASGREDMVRRAATAPLRRAGTTGEIASVVAFLLSEESAYMTGEVVSVDGGSAIVSTVRPSGGAGAWDFAALDQRTYRGEE